MEPEIIIFERLTDIIAVGGTPTIAVVVLIIWYKVTQISKTLSKQGERIAKIEGMLNANPKRPSTS